MTTTVNTVLGPVFTVPATVDLLLCNTFQIVAPSTVPLNPVVVINPDGDLYVLGAWIYDCPPHGT